MINAVEGVSVPLPLDIHSALLCTAL